MRISDWSSDVCSSDLVGVDRRVAREEADGVLIIPDLRPGIQMLAIVAATDPEVAIVDDERVKAIFSELLRIGRHRDLTHIAPAASEHDSGPTPAFVGCVEPTPNSITFGLELYVKPLNH